MHNDTFDDLCRMIDYYLEHDTEREIIAQLGQNEVLTKHTLDKRVPLYYELMENFGNKKPVMHYFGKE
jgi:spore maturation protein CgeB